jgi:hypothetical protein
VTTNSIDRMLANLYPYGFISQLEGECKDHLTLSRYSGESNMDGSITYTAIVHASDNKVMGIYSIKIDDGKLIRANYEGKHPLTERDDMISVGVKLKFNTYERNDNWHKIVFPGFRSK